MSAQLPQVDVYGAVHKGIRYALLDLLRRMGTVAPSDTSNLDMLFDDLDGAFYLCATHAEQEERYVHRAIEAASPGALTALDAAHAGLGELLEALRAAMADLGGAPAEHKPGLYRRFYLQYSSFVAQCLEHMSQEELGVQALLERLFTTEQIHAIQSSMLASIGPEELKVFLRVMVPAATPIERVSLLAPPKATLPREAFEAIMLTVRRCLNADELRDLERRLERVAV
ncbi:MAG TPA: hemerythrin domain-containing protein [Polyangiales bacterium]|nr:hemerythrin domain-containing protein [Polyangiales bacterium]